MVPDWIQRRRRDRVQYVRAIESYDPLSRQTRAKDGVPTTTAGPSTRSRSVRRDLAQDDTLFAETSSPKKRARASAASGKSGPENRLSGSRDGSEANSGMARARRTSASGPRR